MRSVIVAGAAGRMGSRILSLVKQSSAMHLVGAIEDPGHPGIGQDAGDVVGCGHLDVELSYDLLSVIERGDVVIDYTAPHATLDHARIASEHRRPMVIGTTGFSEEQRERLLDLIKPVPVVLSPNMSVGVNVMLTVIAEMAKAFGDEYDIEVIEAHHRLKKDAPSGTALRIADVLAQARGRNLSDVGSYGRHGLVGERPSGEIGIHTVRAGDIVGEHTVLFGGPGEQIEITHRAGTRDTFASGALRAVEWVVTQPPGLYSMADVLGLSRP